jgi:8-oxo-dGTP diphosphatase
VQEETGLVVKDIRFGAITNDIFKDDHKHYVSIFMVCDYDAGMLENLGPEKCEEWKWVRPDEIPRLLFLSLQHFLHKGIDPFQDRYSASSGHC